MAEQLRRLISLTDKTHKGLGKLTALELTTAKARKTLLVIGSSATGKSTASDFVSSVVPHSRREDKFTVSGLKRLFRELSNSRAVIIVDDLTKAHTHYSRIATVVSLAELIYSHNVAVHTGKESFEVIGFEGSSIINLQPSLFSEIVKSQEWETSLLDKTFRYYHLIRPVDPTVAKIKVNVDWGYEIEQVIDIKIKDELKEKLIEVGKNFWTEARAQEHCIDLLRAIASFDRRSYINDDDAELLLEFLKISNLEKYILIKTAPESPVHLHKSLLYLLTEFISYGEFTLGDICRDYRISEITARRWLDGLGGYWIISQKSPVKYAPSKQLRRIMDEIGGER
jgi:energy-coupling factor transporter ATP-binding protein EcfA2